MTTPRRGYRTCQRCRKNKAVRFFTPKGRICETCRKGTRSATTKDARLRETYGITLVEWQMLLDAQGGRCAICQGKRKQYDVDHDHKLEKALIDSGMQPLIATRMSVRGLLCKRCNRRLLPASMDSPTILTAAMAYLGTPPAQSILTACLP